MNISCETEKFNEAVNLFFGMHPDKKFWILIVLYLAKTRKLRVVDNYEGNGLVLARLDVEMLGSGKLRKEWNDSGVFSRFVLADVDDKLRNIIEKIDYEELTSRFENESFKIKQWEPAYLVEVAETFMSLSDEWFQENTSWASQQILVRSQRGFGRAIGGFYQPNEITCLVASLLDAEEGSVYNPYAGVCSYGVAIGSKVKYIGQEISECYTIGLLNLLLNGKNNVEVEQSDSVSNWLAERQSFEYIVATPPINAHCDSPYKTMDNDFLVRSAECCERKAIGVYPSSFTYNKCVDIERFVSQDLIESVILLPENLFLSTAIPLAIIVVNKQKSTEGKIRFVDASECYVKDVRLNILNHKDVLDLCKSCQNIRGKVAIIPNEEVIENGCILFPRQYTVSCEIEVPVGYRKVRLGDVVNLYHGDNHEYDGQTGTLVTVSDLSSDWCNCEIDRSCLANGIVSRDYNKLTCDAVLVSSIRDFKPSIVRAREEEPVFIKRNIIAIIPNPGIMLEFICMTIAKLKKDSYVFTTPTICKTWLKEVVIALPDLETQQVSAYAEARNSTLMAKAREMGLQEIIEQMKSDYVNEIRSRKHDMMPHLRQLSSACDNIDYYLSNKDSFSQVDFICGMKEEVFNQKNAIESLTAILKIFSREDRFGTPEVVNIDEYLMNHYFDGTNYTVDYDTDYEALAEYGFDIPEELRNPHIDVVNGRIVWGKPEKDYVEGANVLIAKDDLHRLFDNIINNAIKHGFTEPNRGDYYIFTTLSIDPKLGMFQIDISNNGSPLPKGLDKLRYGLKGEKAGSTAGTGEGGYIVKSIVEHYKGDYDIFSTNSGETEITTVRVLLPIYHTDE